MPLRPINLVYFGDLYRFFIDTSRLPEVSLDHIECFLDCRTHSEPVEWEETPLELREMLIEKINEL